MRLSAGQISAAVYWWSERIKLVKPIKCEPHQAAQAEAVIAAAIAAGPITDAQLEAFATTLEQVLDLYDGPETLEVGTTWTSGVSPHLAAAIVAAGIQPARLQCGITVTFRHGGVQVRDGVGANLVDVYVEPMSIDIAFDVLTDVNSVAESELCGDPRGDQALEFLKAAVQQLKAPRYAVGDAKHVELWDAIDELIGACGGNRTAKSVARMTCVARVERALVALAGEPNP